MEVGSDASRAPARWIGVLVVGSVVAVDPGGLAPFGPARWWVVSTLGFAAGAFTLWRGRRPVHRRSAIAWAVLLAFVLVGALTNGDAPTALLGHPERHLGVITWVLFALLFAAGQQLGTAEQRTTLARSATAALAVIGLWSVWELAFGPPIDVNATTDRLTGPFGSAAFLGAAVCLLGPFAIGRAAITTAPRAERVTSAVAAAVGAIALVGSGARAAWVAAAIIGLAVSARRRPSRRTSFAIGVGLVAAFAVVAPRLTEVTDRSAGATSRLDEWTVATRVIAEHPLVGVGPDGYRIAVADGIDRHYERTYGRSRVIPDRAHSGPLDVALAGGVPAALAYAALLVFLARRAWRSFTADPTTAALAAGVTAYGMQQLLLFPLAELDPVWWVLAGTLVSVPSTPDVPHRPVRTAGVIAASAVSLLAFVAGLLDVAADRLARSALRTDDPVTAIDDAERAVALRPDDLRYRMVLAVLHRDRGTLADVDAAIHEADDALRWSENDPIALDQRASALTDRAVITGDADDVGRALRAWTELVERDPHRARWQLELGRAAALAGDTDLARRSWTVAADLDPHDHTAADLLAQLGE